jgi:hypothetical protein
VQLNKTEATFVDAVHREFGFLATDAGFVEQPVDWDGRGISVVYPHPSLKIKNYLEADVLYEASVTPLKNGTEPDRHDEHFHEIFVDFNIDEITKEGQSRNLDLDQFQYPDVRKLEEAVAVRAALLRENLAALLSDDRPLVGFIRDRVRERQLTSLISRWIEFVARVRDGFGGTVNNYVSGINIRAAIESYLRWPGVIDPEMNQQLRLADGEFDGFTVPMRYAGPPKLSHLHARARRWWRAPENMEDTLQEWFARGVTDV